MCLAQFAFMGEFKEYKGYTGSIEYCIPDFVYFGKILKIDDHVDYEAKDVIDLEKQFHKAVDDYIEFKKGIELTEEKKMEDAMIRAVINGGIKGRDLIDLWQERGLIAVYHLGMKHMYEYLKGDSNG